MGLDNRRITMDSTSRKRAANEYFEDLRLIEIDYQPISWFGSFMAVFALLAISGYLIFNDATIVLLFGSWSDGVARFLFARWARS